ncbi:putative spanin [Vibrio phage PhiImVa-1]|uniref:Lipoprotein n=1 Tax=Vibrio phage BUCT194 TaxID=2859072 RepID=A0AAE9BPY7_9CAUD|nr:hypothetical protein PP741_gp008 [Vibrio phage BUCT194]UAW01115.1 hypothetical protein [Vibrio phage BUCT194]UOX40319.1 putative spanin [Vibrio phage PhiImVa-1]
MKKYLWLSLIALALMGCEPTPPKAKNNYILPAEMSHCKVYSIYDGVKDLYTIYCPQATTVTCHDTGGKTNTTICTTTVVDPELIEYKRLKAKYD